MRIPDLGYGLLLGGPNYYPSSAETEFSQGMPPNCDSGARTGGTRDLPDDGGTCFTLAFPFIGSKQYGCDSRPIQGGYGGPYVECIPPFLKDEGFISFAAPIRIAITLGLLWAVFR